MINCLTLLKENLLINWNNWIILLLNIKIVKIINKKSFDLKNNLIIKH